MLMEVENCMGGLVETLTHRQGNNTELFESTIQKITEAMQGRTVSPSHREAIAAGQRRRHARRRALVAMEALHQELTAVDAGCDSKESAADAADAAAAALRQLRSSSVPRQPMAAGIDTNRARSLSPMIANDMLDDVHQEYAARLRSFRHAQKEVKPWIESFQAQHGRRPTLEDALACGDVWVAEKYKHYQVQKDGLTSEIPTMRDALTGRTKGSSASNSSGRRCGTGFNGNIDPVSAAEATARVQAAMTYRRQRQEKQSTASTESAAVFGSVPELQAPLDASDRIVGLQARVETSASGANSRAKAAILKALRYKQRGAASAQAQTLEDPGSSRPAPSGSAVRLVPVEGKAIGGVDYSGIDASGAAAGESQLIQAGHMPVTSYRDSDRLGDSMKSVENDGSALLEPGEESEDIKVSTTVHATSTSSACTESSTLVRRPEKISPVHLSGEGVPSSDVACDARDSEPDQEGGVLQRPDGHACSGLDGADSDVVWNGLDLQPSRVSGVAACSDLAPTAAGANSTTAAALFELRGKQAAATAAVEAAAAAAVLAIASERSGSSCKLDMGDGSLISAACAAARRAEQVHTEFDEARRSVMQLLRDGADTYCGGLMFLRRLL